MSIKVFFSACIFNELPFNYFTLFQKPRLDKNLVNVYLLNFGIWDCVNNITLTNCRIF